VTKVIKSNGDGNERLKIKNAVLSKH